MTHLLFFPLYINPQLEFSLSILFLPTVDLSCPGMSNLYFNFFFQRFYWLYLSCCSHRPLKNINYKQMGLILGIHKFRHVIDISTMMALLTEIEHHLVWSSYIIMKVCFLLEPLEVLDTRENSGQNEKKITYDNKLFFNRNHLSLSVSLLKCIKENRSIDKKISP